MTTVEVVYDCGHTYTAPTRIPDGGSALRHAVTVDTVADLVDAWHAAEHPECAGPAAGAAGA